MEIRNASRLNFEEEKEEGRTPGVRISYNKVKRFEFSRVRLQQVSAIFRKSSKLLRRAKFSRVNFESDRRRNICQTTTTSYPRSRLTRLIHQNEQNYRPGISRIEISAENTRVHARNTRMANENRRNTRRAFFTGGIYAIDDRAGAGIEHNQIILTSVCNNTYVQE